MPAGIQAMKLEELERRLRTDIMQEAIAWAGRVMLHKEVSLDSPAARQPHFDQAAAPSKSTTHGGSRGARTSRPAKVPAAINLCSAGITLRERMCASLCPTKGMRAHVEWQQCPPKHCFRCVRPMMACQVVCMPNTWLGQTAVQC